MNWRLCAGAIQYREIQSVRRCVWYASRRRRILNAHSLDRGRGHAICLTLGYLACVGNLAASDGTYVRTLQRDDSDSLSVQGNEFNLERLAVAIDVHHRADVTRCEFLAGQVGREHYAVMFLDCNHSRSPIVGKL